MDALDPQLIPVPSEPLDIPTFSPAGQPEILRAHQRDQAQLGRLTELTRDVLRSAFGSRQVLPKENLISLLSAVVYFGLTFGRGSQTIGEEYVDIQPRSVLSDRNPTRRRRLFTLFLTILSPPLFRLILQRLRAQVPRRPPPTGGVTFPPRTFKEKLLDAMEKLESWVDVASELNLAWFFLRGGFFDLGKRIAGVGYVSTLPPPTDPSASDRPTYSVLGLLLLLPLLKRLPTLPSPFSSAPTAIVEPEELAPTRFHLPNTKLPLLDPTEADVASAAPPPPVCNSEKGEASQAFLAAPKDARKCTLCLEEWTDPSVTECGHVFCWVCIVGWSGEKAECPLCRQDLNPSRLLPLYNM